MKPFPSTSASEPRRHRLDRRLHQIYFHGAGIYHFLARRCRPAGIAFSLVLVLATCLGIGHDRTPVYQLFSLTLGMVLIAIPWAISRLAALEARRELRDLACTCKTCDRPFVFTVAEQEFFAAQGWPIPRPRCKACSTSKKSGTKRAADPAANHLRTDAPPKKPRLDTPPEKPPAVGTSGGAGKAEATRSASVATQLSCFLCGQMGHVAKACTVKTASTQELSAALKAARARENAQLLATRAQNPERNQPDDVADAQHVKNKKPIGFHRGRKEGKKGRT